MDNYLKRHRTTLLGVGPMSVNCVNATIELANDYEIPLMLIASRRQIDSEEFGGGYVNNWTTDEFARYVIDNDKKGKVLLARDHGGPWQNDKEKKEQLSLRSAMDSAKVSYKADIDAGFQILHIDPSVDIFGHPNVDEIIDRAFELYEYCWNYAQQQGQEIIFEIGTEEQSGSTNTLDELDYSLNAMLGFCKKNHLPKPTFVVIQTGTRVMETRNIGSFDTPVRVADEIPAEIQVPKMIEICRKYGIFLKQHNTDYLSDEALKWHPRLGIHSANVAPEFGVAETKALVEMLETSNLQSIADEFLKLALDSNKWEKWMLPNSLATDKDRAIIAGHYIFATEACCEIKQRATVELKKKGIELENELKNSVKQSIMRYLLNFRMVRSA
ncbi:MAG: class II D-tagatose-bisphosphate aldolase, non-catalytic subunit [Sedimenticola sp.]